MLEYLYNATVSAILWDPNKVIDIEKCEICGGGRLESFTAGHFLYLIVRTKHLMNRNHLTDFHFEREKCSNIACTNLSGWIDVCQ